ncbi:MAG: hypothetical protein MJ212_06145, partial [Alphaproteobacteria bacterium]|nr:hypothetical protein [Alphaproteobacteria bacterium]
MFGQRSGITPLRYVLGARSLMLTGILKSASRLSANQLFAASNSTTQIKHKKNPAARARLFLCLVNVP